MQVTLMLAWWHIPTALTVIALAWAFFWPADRGGMFGGMTTLFMMVPALAVIALAWGIAGFFK